MKNFIKNIIVGVAAILLLFIFASCGRGTDENVVERESEVDSIVYYDFKESLKNGIKLIPVEIYDGMIYADDRLIYTDEVFASSDGLKLVNIISQSFLVKKNKEIDNTNYTINPFSFSSDVQKIIMTINGSKWDDKDSIDEEYFDTINNIGLYSISGIDEDIIRVLNKELLFKYCEDRYDGTWINVGGVTDIDKQELIDINKELKSKMKNSNDINYIYKLFAVKNEGTFPEYRNYFNKDGYTVVDGFIVQSKSAVDHMNTLSTFDQFDYQAIEKEVFKLNNKNAVIYDGKTYTMSTYKKGEFLSSGKPAWITRVNGEETVDIYGNRLYADCGKTFDEFKIYCGGTDIAFRGWKDEINVDPDELYNAILKGSGSWDDAMFVDEQVKYIPVRNDDPKYYQEHIEKIKAKEKEDLDKYVSDRLEQIESK